MPPVELLGIKEAAKALDVHENTIRRWADAGLVQVVRLPTGVRRIPAESVSRLQQQMYKSIGMATLEAYGAAAAKAR